MKITFLFDNPFADHYVPCTVHAKDMEKAKQKALKCFTKRGITHADWSWKIKLDNRKTKRGI